MSAEWWWRYIGVLLYLIIVYCSAICRFLLIFVVVNRSWCRGRRFCVLSCHCVASDSFLSMFTNYVSCFQFIVSSKMEIHCSYCKNVRHCLNGFYKAAFTHIVLVYIDLCSRSCVPIINFASIILLCPDVFNIFCHEFDIVRTVYHLAILHM